MRTFQVELLSSSHAKKPALRPGDRVLQYSAQCDEEDVEHHRRRITSDGRV